MAVLYILNIWIPLEGFRAEGFFFYSLGAYLCIGKFGILRVSERLKNYTIPLALITLSLCVFFYGQPHYWYARRVFCICGTISLFWIVSYIVQKKRSVKLVESKFLVESSFVLFAAHVIGIRDIVCTSLNYIVSLSIFNSIIVHELILTLAYILAPVLITIFVLILFYFGKKHVPKVCALLTGGRINMV